MAQPTTSLIEYYELAALRTFLLGVLPPGTPVIKGQVNRVAESKNPDFVVFWPIRQTRLATNVTEYYDNVVTGSIAGTVLTVTAIEQQESELSAGMLLTDGTAGEITANTILGSQLTGSAGGTGTYSVLPSQNLGAETLYAGVAAALAPTEWVVQCDVHGPNSGNNVRVIETLFRSEYGVDAFTAADGSQASVIPLWCDEAKQMPFINAESQYEYRWTLDLRMQINVIVGTSQQFADELTPVTIPVDLNLVF